VVIPDINLLVFSYNEEAPRHGTAREWWEGLMTGREPVGIPWVVATDTHLAALAIEYQCELHSSDADFARFPGLRWHNPLERSVRPSG
jgi:predicted nucleic acid-binding protein